MVVVGDQPPGSFDKVGLVDHAAGLATRDADEDAFVEPLEAGGGGLDLGRGAEGVLPRVDVLMRPENSGLAATPSMYVR